AGEVASRASPRPGPWTRRDTVKFHEMTAPELREVPRASTLVLAPLAACEQHGPHLPTYTDTILVTASAGAVGAGLPQRVLALRPDLVRRDRIQDDPPRDDPALRGLFLADDMRQRTDHGAVGYPEQATAEKGRAFLNAAVRRTAELASALLLRPLPS